MVFFILVRVARIELASLAWKAGILAIIRHPRMGRMSGIEPPTFWTTIRRSNQLSYIRHFYNVKYVTVCSKSQLVRATQTINSLKAVQLSYIRLVRTHSTDSILSQATKVSSFRCSSS